MTSPRNAGVLRTIKTVPFWILAFALAGVSFAIIDFFIVSPLVRTLIVLPVAILGSALASDFIQSKYRGNGAKISQAERTFFWTCFILYFCIEYGKVLYVDPDSPSADFLRRLVVVGLVILGVQYQFRRLKRS